MSRAKAPVSIRSPEIDADAIRRGLRLGAFIATYVYHTDMIYMLIRLCDHCIFVLGDSDERTQKLFVG